MEFLLSSHWHRITGSLALAALLTVSFVPVAQSQTPPAAEQMTLMLRPHCEGAKDDGTVGSQTACKEFTAIDSKTFTTDTLKSGDTLDLDLIAINPNKQSINRVRAWLLYNPATLNGTAIKFSPSFPLITPGEQDFSPTEGQVKLDSSAAAGAEPAGSRAVIARITFVVKQVPEQGKDILTFYDIQPTGHTFVTTKTGGKETSLLAVDPASVLLSFENGGSSSNPSDAPSDETGLCGNGIIEPPETCDDGDILSEDGCSSTCRIESGWTCTSTDGPSACTKGTAQTGSVDGTVCAGNADCKSGLCAQGICKGDVLKVEGGGACNASTQCASGSCELNTCTGGGQSSSAPTAFSLLQVRSLRVTTEGSTTFLAWDPMVSSQLKGYNVYYGGTSGRYLQRKTVPPDTRSIAIRALPEKTMYYFAVRAVNTKDEESAFSQEVSIEVGNPASSTSPLSKKDTPVGSNPIGQGSPSGMPGETGVSSTLVWLILGSAIIGTLLAFRRQRGVLLAPPVR